VLCVMLADGRQKMVERAIRCFNRQTYPQRTLLILDSGKVPLDLQVARHIHVTRLGPSEPRRTIGFLRNLANCTAVGGCFNAPIIAHWDSDDYSGPLRLEEQVKLLETSGADAVGYHQMLFWNCDPNRQCANAICQLTGMHEPKCGEAWLYSSPNLKYCMGTSLLYWRRAWEKHPFPDKQIGEDTEWQMKVKTAAETSVRQPPRMIATIHGRNTTAAIKPGVAEWSRAQMLDAECWRALAL